MHMLGVGCEKSTKSRLSDFELIPVTQGSRSNSDLAISLGVCQAILELGAFSRRSQHGCLWVRFGESLRNLHKQSLLSHSDTFTNTTDPETPVGSGPKTHPLPHPTC